MYLCKEKSSLFVMQYSTREIGEESERKLLKVKNNITVE